MLVFVCHSLHLAIKRRDRKKGDDDLYDNDMMMFPCIEYGCDYCESWTINEIIENDNKYCYNDLKISCRDTCKEWRCFKLQDSEDGLCGCLVNVLNSGMHYK